MIIIYKKLIQIFLAGIAMWSLAGCGGSSTDTNSIPDILLDPVTEPDPVTAPSPVIEPDPVVDVQAPTVPGNLRATNIATNQISISWNASSDNVAVTEYKVYLNGSSSALTTTGSLTYTHTGLVPDQTYQYRVTALDAEGNESAQSSVLSVNTMAIPDTTSPSIPANLRTTNVTANEISLAWDAATDNVAVVGYRLYRDGSLTELANTSSTSYTDSNLTASQAYQARVTALDAAGNESSMSVVLDVTTQAPPVPKALNISWNPPTQYTDDSCLTDIEGFDISYGNDSGSYHTTKNLVLSSGQVSCVQEGFDSVCNQPVMRCSYTTEALMPGDWYFVVQTYNSSGVRSFYSVEGSKTIN